jgi:hypothetical protein
MKLLVDLDRAAAECVVSAGQAEALRRRAAAETAELAINVLLALGVIGVAIGFLWLEPPIPLGAAFGVAVAALGFVLRAGAARWGLLGTAMVLVGVLVLAGGILRDWHGDWGAFLGVAALLAGAAALAGNGLLAALVPFALAAALGSSTAYGHAFYELWVTEPTVTIVAFALLALAGEAAARALGEGWGRLLRIFARVCVVWVNLGFWVGSLWGDRPLALWRVGPGAGQGWMESYPWHIPALAFAIGWAVALAAAGAWGARANRRWVVNAAAVFGAIHFYTQFFERLEASPGTLMLAGLIAIGAAIGLWRFNRGGEAA